MACCPNCAKPLPDPMALTPEQHAARRALYELGREQYAGAIADQLGIGSAYGKPVGRGKRSLDSAG